MNNAGTAAVAVEATGTLAMVVFSWSVKRAVTMDSDRLSAEATLPRSGLG
jgi:hypothetical protein